MRTHVYIDGFNLYYGALRNSPHKWLDVSHMCGLLLPKNEILKIKYFTARVMARDGDPGQPARQRAYLEALSTVPNLEVRYGHFRSSVVSLRLADNSGVAKVTKWEEKGSDVNLATHLVRDAFQENLGAVAVVSNDSDLAEALLIARDEVGLEVGLLPPVLSRDRDGKVRPVSNVLRREATFTKPIRRGVLKDSQFPSTIHFGGRQIYKPTSW